jgi:hypothetical protein
MQRSHSSQQYNRYLGFRKVAPERGDTR